MYNISLYYIILWKHGFTTLNRNAATAWNIPNQKIISKSIFAEYENEARLDLLYVIIICSVFKTFIVIKIWHIANDSSTDHDLDRDQ